MTTIDGDKFIEDAVQFRALPTVGRPPFPPFAASGEPIWEWRGDEASGTHRAVAHLADPERVGNSQVSVALARIPAGQAAPWHFHHHHEEFVFILEGTGEFWCDGQLVAEISPGTVNIIPPNSWHTHRAVKEDLVFLWGYAPPGPQLEA